jgi:hypothetical protein
VHRAPQDFRRGARRREGGVDEPLGQPDVAPPQRDRREAAEGDRQHRVPRERASPRRRRLVYVANGREYDAPLAEQHGVIGILAQPRLESGERRRGESLRAQRLRQQRVRPHPEGRQGDGLVHAPFGVAGPPGAQVQGGQGFEDLDVPGSIGHRSLQCANGGGSKTRIGRGT